MFKVKPPIWQPILRFLKLSDPPDEIGGLWVGDPRTGQVEEVGRLKNYSKEKPYGPVGDVRWLPGGKKLSFVYNHELYTVPAD